MPAHNKHQNRYRFWRTRWFEFRRGTNGRHAAFESRILSMGWTEYSPGKHYFWFGKWEFWR